MIAAMSQRLRPGRIANRQTLVQQLGRDVVRFQEASYLFDDVAAEVLAVHRSDLPAMTMLLFGGPASAAELAAALHLRLASVKTTVERLLLAGYARPQPGDRSRIELTAHARQWIERIWAPLRDDGERLSAQYSTANLRMIAAFLTTACEMQEGRTARLRSWLALPSSPAARPHLRGGLSPAAAQRVQLFIVGYLGRPIHLEDLSTRAGLSPYHFARAFKTSMGVPPRVFVEQRRIERARALLGNAAYSIADVAALAGFTTQSRLTTVFRRHTGFTPATFRRNLRH